MASAPRSDLTFFSRYPSSSETIHKRRRSCVHVRCGPKGNRGPLLKGRVLSTEAIQAVQALKRAHRADPLKVNDHLSKTLSRLIKSDLIAAFNELLRQDHCDLALRVFSTVRSEYKVELTPYADLVSALARKGMYDNIDRLMCGLEGEGVIEFDAKGLLRLVMALIAAGRAESTVRIYELMKRSGWGSTHVADDYLVSVLSRGLRRLGKVKVAADLDREFGRLSQGILGKNDV